MAKINFTEIKDAADFEVVLNHYGLTTTGSGEQKTMCCPFHQEKTASCKVHTGKKIFHCFGCGAKGNVLDFVTKMENGNPDEGKDFKRGAEKAAEIMGISHAQRPQNAPEASKPSKAATTKKISKNAAYARPDEPINPPLTFGNGQGLKLDQDHPFLKDRGLTKKQIETFGLGYANRGMMKQRICFPIHDEHSNLIAYAGRWMEETVPTGQLRYKLPKNFHKSYVLYNLHRVKNDYPKTEHIVLVEGFWSAIRLHTAGIPAVAIMGTSASEEQVVLLKQSGIKKVTLIFDGDEAGEKGAKAALLILANHFFVKNIKLEDGIKPDSMSQEIVNELAG